MWYLVLLALAPGAEDSSWTKARFGEKTILLHPECQPLDSSLLGPFVKLGDGSEAPYAGFLHQRGPE